VILPQIAIQAFKTQAGAAALQNFHEAKDDASRSKPAVPPRVRPAEQFLQKGFGEGKADVGADAVQRASSMDTSVPCPALDHDDLGRHAEASGALSTSARRSTSASMRLLVKMRSPGMRSCFFTPSGSLPLSSRSMTFLSDGRAPAAPSGTVSGQACSSPKLTRLINTDPKHAGQKPMTSNPR